MTMDVGVRGQAVKTVPTFLLGRLVVPPHSQEIPGELDGFGGHR